MLHLYTHQTHMDTELIPLFCPAQVLWWAEQTWLNVHLPLQASRQTWIISVSHEKKLFLWSSFKWHQSCDDWEAPGRRSFMEKFLSWRTLRLLTWRDQQGGGGVMVWGWCSSSLNNGKLVWSLENNPNQKIKTLLKVPGWFCSGELLQLDFNPSVNGAETTDSVLNLLDPESREQPRLTAEPFSQSGLTTSWGIQDSMQTRFHTPTWNLWTFTVAGSDADLGLSDPSRQFFYQRLCRRTQNSCFSCRRWPDLLPVLYRNLSPNIPPWCR